MGECTYKFHGKQVKIREQFVSQFSLSTMWPFGIKFRSSGSAASAFTH